jgi:hypothetical protein
MIKLEKTEVLGWEAAIRGMRNPMNSWDKSDSDVKCSVLREEEVCPGVTALVSSPCAPFISIGPNDHELMVKLAKGGSVHAKYRRMIHVSVDITAPLYWWKEFDTYKVGTTSNSCSTMHKIHAKEFTMEDFSCEKLAWDEDDVVYRAGLGEELNYVTHYHYLNALKHTIDALNSARDHYLQVESMIKNGALPEESLSDRRRFYWDQMIQLLPSSYNQKRTIDLDYEVLVGMYRDRKSHKLDEWHVLCKWIEGLPYSELITGGENGD